ncbi:uncharacterized protein LOC105207290 [Solenopsis invicta]|uniref:uncharacterized protein LOC105207290 n=1 Tax=Solenopsis invicta TaxID=13686 RepID=UPI00193C9BD2|nr:uncharacterized protein LOC105207290 [Solenopsis invicta]
MKKHGHDVTGPQCLSKFSGLKRTYKSIKDNNKKSGSGARMWPYFSNMDELLHSKPYMSPLTTLSSTGKRTEKSSEFNSISDTCNDVAGPSSSRVNLDDEKPVHKKSRQMSTVEKYIEDLRQEKKVLEDAMERRHREVMQSREQFLFFMEKMLEIMSKK